MIVFRKLQQPTFSAKHECERCWKRFMSNKKRESCFVSLTAADARSTTAAFSLAANKNLNFARFMLPVFTKRAVIAGTLFGSSSNRNFDQSLIIKLWCLSNRPNSSRPNSLDAQVQRLKWIRLRNRIWIAIQQKDQQDRAVETNKTNKTSGF